MMWLQYLMKSEFKFSSILGTKCEPYIVAEEYWATNSVVFMSWLSNNGLSYFHFVDLVKQIDCYGT